MISDKPLNTDINTAVKDISSVASRNQKPDPLENSEVQRNSESAKSAAAPSPVSAQEIKKEIKTQADQELDQVQREELKERVNEAIPKVRELMQKNQRSLDFKVAEEDNRVVITVIDEETDTVIRQIPPEDVLKIAASIEQGLKPGGGSILNDKA